MNGERTWTFKEIDQSLGLVKGRAFIAFKRVRDGLIEGQDYVYYNGTQQSREVHALKEAGRLYDSSPHAVVFTQSACQCIVAYLQSHPELTAAPVAKRTK